MNLTDAARKQLLFNAERIWRERFARASNIIREYGQNELADMIDGIASTTFDVNGPKVEKSSRIEIQDKIEAHIRLNRECDIHDLKSAFNLSRYILSEHLRVLMSDRRIEKYRLGVQMIYRIPTKLKAVG